MRAMRFSDYGGPDVLREVEVEEPHAGPGETRMAVRAAGVNPIDWKLRSGLMRRFMPVDLPSTPGTDVAGVVDEVGAGVSGTEVGDPVFGFATTGSAAAHALLRVFAHMPPGLGWAEAAALPVAVETATRALDELGVIGGQTVLVSGAAGGVGLAAVQLARLRGAAVVGTASEANHAYLRGLGVLATTYGAGLVQRVRELVPAGVDRALDVAGHGVLGDLVELTGDPGRVLTVTDPDAAAHGVRMSRGGSDEHARSALQDAAALVGQGELAVPVAAAFPLAELAAAHRRSETGHVLGKIVVLV